jgi:hypothetical protein
VNPHARSCHKDQKVDDLPFEIEMKDWVIEQRSMDIAVRTKDIINHVLKVIQLSKMDHVQNCLHRFTSSLCIMVYLCAM